MMYALKANNEVISIHKCMDDALDAMYAHMGFDKGEAVSQKTRYKIVGVRIRRHTRRKE